MYGKTPIRKNHEKGAYPPCLDCSILRIVLLSYIEVSAVYDGASLITIPPVLTNVINRFAVLVAGVAQWLEQRTCNAQVAGSSPAASYKPRKSCGV